MRRLYSGLAFALALIPGALSAHPLGNFTINHLARVTTRPDAVQVHYVLDIAEIPSFQIASERTKNGSWDKVSLAKWASDESALVRGGLTLTVDGKTANLQIAGSPSATLRPGAGGLPTLYWTADYTTAIAPGVQHQIALVDRVYSERRIGWKDVIAGKETEPTSELRSYPSALLGTPRRVDAVSLVLAPSGAIATIDHSVDATPASGTLSSTLSSWVSPTALSDMFAKENPTPGFIFLTILVAFGLGALHALEPGHGKALLAFTLVGARATSVQALILATSLTVAHTAGVLLLGLVLFFAAGFVSENIYPWITLVSGIAIAAIGARALARFVLARRGLAHQHAHAHDGAHQHSHDHEHGPEGHHHDHDSAHGHSHAIPGSQPLGFKTAIAAALSGGIAPCPAAIVVLLAALRLHQVGYGVFLIVVFSLGLATVLSALGIAVVHGSSWLSRRSAYAKFAPFGPLVTASVISIIGATMVGQGFSESGVNAPAIVISGLTFCAIVGYALAQQGHAHSHSGAAAT